MGTEKRDQPTAVHGPPRPGHDAPPPYEGPAAQPAAANAPFPPPPPAATTVIQHRLVFAGPPPVGSNSTLLTCPYCHDTVSTRVEVKPSQRTHTNALLMCIIGGLLCFWIPYVIDDCQSKRHFCPSCGAYLGTYNN